MGAAWATRDADANVPADLANRRASDVPTLLTEEQNGLRYEFHVPSGREALYDVARDAEGLVNLIDSREEEASACRRALAVRYGVADLTLLRARYAESIRRLHALGYL